MANDVAQKLKDDLNAQFGAGTVKMGSEVGPVAHWPIGILPLDVVFDGGLPVGRFTEVYGDYSTMKSYMALSACAEVQRLGGTAAYIDQEHAFDEPWARSIGVDTDDLIKPPFESVETGEKALMVMEGLIRGGVDLLVWDSIASSQPKQYAEKAPGDDSQPAGLARMMSNGLRRLNSCNRTTAILALNQTRVNVGVTFGSAMTTPGGRAMPFYASYRMRLVKAGNETEDIKIWNGEKLEGGKRRTKQKIKVSLEKWKLNADIRDTYMILDLRTGKVDEGSYIVGWLIEQGYVEVKQPKSGAATYSMDELSIRGRDKFIETITADEGIMDWVREELTKDHVIATPSASPTSQSPAKSKGVRKKSSNSDDGEQ